jgi:hypothetical protein
MALTIEAAMKQDDRLRQIEEKVGMLTESSALLTRILRAAQLGKTEFHGGNIIELSGLDEKDEIALQNFMQKYAVRR